MDDRTTALEALLRTRDWKAADEETRRLLIADVDIGGYVGVDADEASRIDCNLLAAIDSLWTESTDGQFGLAAQEAILADVIAQGLPPNDAWRLFGRKVGWVTGREWIERDDVRYSLDAPEGHLPYVPGIGTVVVTGRIYEGYLRFYSRVSDCLN